MIVSIQLRAQKLFSKPKNSSEFAGRILADQKNWQQLQLPKNSIQYKLNPPVVFTYAFGQKPAPVTLSIKLPGENEYYGKPFHYNGNNKSHPYLKYYPSYTGKLQFDKKLYIRH